MIPYRIVMTIVRPEEPFLRTKTILYTKYKTKKNHLSTTPIPFERTNRTNWTKNYQVFKSKSLNFTANEAWKTFHIEGDENTTINPSHPLNPGKSQRKIITRLKKDYSSDWKLLTRIKKTIKTSPNRNKKKIIYNLYISYLILMRRIKKKHLNERTLERIIEADKPNAWMWDGLYMLIRCDEKDVKSDLKYVNNTQFKASTVVISRYCVVAKTDVIPW